MAVWLDLERSAALFVVAVISGAREDSAGRGRRRLEVHYRLREELSALANEMLDLFVSLPTLLKCHIRPGAGATLAGLIMSATVS